MTPRGEFVDHVLETMRIFGPVEPKAMFGGWGLYHAGLFFALISENILYLKVDAESRAPFDELRLPPFVYESRLGEKTVMHYHQAPVEALESPEVMAEWARRSYAAALRAATARPAPRRRSTATPRS
jgi:DNA transformation protein and related proteins